MKSTAAAWAPGRTGPYHDAPARFYAGRRRARTARAVSELARDMLLAKAVPDVSAYCTLPMSLRPVSELVGEHSVPVGGASH